MIYIFLLVLSFSLTYFIKNYAIKKSLVAQVNERSSHTIPTTPHGGGIAIVVTWFIGIVYLYIYNQIEPNLFYALLVGIIISVVSFFDATMTIVRRKLNGEQITQAHKKHGYQRLQQSGWSHLHVSLFGMGINALLFMIVYFISNIAIAFLSSLIVLYGMMRFIDSKKKFK